MSDHLHLPIHAVTCIGVFQHQPHDQAGQPHFFIGVIEQSPKVEVTGWTTAYPLAGWELVRIWVERL